MHAEAAYSSGAQHGAQAVHFMHTPIYYILFYLPKRLARSMIRLSDPTASDGPSSRSCRSLPAIVVMVHELYMHQDCNYEAIEAAHVCAACRQCPQGRVHSGAVCTCTGHHHRRCKRLTLNGLTRSIAVQASGQQSGGGQGIMPDQRLRSPPHLAPQARQHAQATFTATPVSLRSG